jgi:hypothetical protein
LLCQSGQCRHHARPPPTHAPCPPPPTPATYTAAVTAISGSSAEVRKASMSRIVGWSPSGLIRRTWRLAVKSTTALAAGRWSNRNIVHGSRRRHGDLTSLPGHTV